MKSCLAVVSLSFAFASAVRAQSPAEIITLGDREYAALNASAALSHYENAMAKDARSYEALWKASRSAIDLGSSVSDAARRRMLFATGEQYARRAIALNPADAEGRFSLARALGKTALEQSVRGRIRYATEIRTQALECLKMKPAHAGCLHVMGVWNAEVMRLNSVARMLARNVLGGRVFGAASWSDAVRFMEAAVTAEPDRIVHRVDLAEIYGDVGQKVKARAEYEMVLKLPVTDVSDSVYKAQARSALAAR